MKSGLKIAILSGSIPSTSFIERLIAGVAKQYKVLLFGTVTKRPSYVGQVVVYGTPKRLFSNVLVSTWRTALLLVRSPKGFWKLLHQVKGMSGFYNQFVWYTKYLPIVLYRPDILHLQWAKDVAYYMWFQDSLGIPIVLSLRGAHVNYSPITIPELAEVYTHAFPRIKGFHAVSKAIGSTAIRYGACKERIRVIYSPVPQALLESYRPYEKRSLPLELILVGRFHWVKGYEYVLKSLAILKQQGVAFQCRIISNDAMSESFLFQLHQLELTDVVSVVGSLPSTSVYEAMQDSDVLLLPSLIEGIANVVLEAMALGVPVISTDCGGMAEVVKPGQTGWLVPTRDAETMAATVIAVRDASEPELQRITKNAHDLVKEQFCAKDKIGEFLELYEEVVAVNNEQ